MDEDNNLDSEKLKKYFAGSFSEEDASYVENVFCDKNNEKDLKYFLSNQFEELLPDDEDDKKNLDHILYRLNYDINSKIIGKKTRILDSILTWTFRIAGIIILPFLILQGIHSYKETILKKETWVEIKAPAWTRAQFSLPDGTVGWLNSNSSVRYNGNFITDRNVTLTGEAFFDVYKDKNRPFIVNTNDVIVKVLGTRFNISSYENENDVEVVLEEGSLILQDSKLDRSVKMNPNDLAIYNKTRKDIETETVQPQKYLAWTEGKLVFRNDPLAVISRRLERWYNVDVEVNVSLCEELRLRATFKDENLEEVLDLLKHSLPIDYKIEKGNLNYSNTYVKKKVIIFPKNK
jgi:transmembrane sensor